MQIVSSTRPARRLTAAVIAGGLVLSACGGSSATTETSVGAEPATATTSQSTSQATAPAAARTVLAVSGNQIEVAPAGQDTLLWFWAPW